MKRNAEIVLDASNQVGLEKTQGELSMSLCAVARMRHRIII
jgi:hypothetical protein